MVGNLECFLQSMHGENTLKIPRLKTTVETLNYLKDLHLNLVSLANNHAYDNLEDGFKKTINTLDKLNISYLGAGLSTIAAQKPFFSTIKGLRFCFLNYLDLCFKHTVPEFAKVYLNWLRLEKVKHDIQGVRQRADFVILLLHWGGDVEGLNYPSLNQPYITNKLVQFGADLIIGHHTHTFQPYEVIQGNHVLYSLGNFCFSDGFF
jgi:poly-gamma-glutamate synthesis protein (capsule biosynthesis protein)